MSEHLERIRLAELDIVRPYFNQANKRVLELGGGNGWQASIMASWACEVTSIDIIGRFAPERQYFPVIIYDGKNFPFADGSFDIVFSSNVLEHIKALSAAFHEIKRVLKPGGIAIHIVPTSSWRLFTSIAHYGYVFSRLIGGGRVDTKFRGIPAMQTVMKDKGTLYFLKRALFSGPHGEYPSAVSELYYFRQSRWSRLFKNNGFSIIETRSSRLFYTGYGLSKGMSIERRRFLSWWLGSSSVAFVMRNV